MSLFLTFHLRTTGPLSECGTSQQVIGEAVSIMCKDSFCRTQSTWPVVNLPLGLALNLSDTFFMGLAIAYRAIGIVLAFAIF